MQANSSDFKLFVIQQYLCHSHRHYDVVAARNLEEAKETLLDFLIHLYYQDLIDSDKETDKEILEESIEDLKKELNDPYLTEWLDSSDVSIISEITVNVDKPQVVFQFE